MGRTRTLTTHVSSEEVQLSRAAARTPRPPTIRAVTRRDTRRKDSSPHTTRKRAASPAPSLMSPVTAETTFLPRGLMIISVTKEEMPSREVIKRVAYFQAEEASKVNSGVDSHLMTRKVTRGQ